MPGGRPADREIITFWVDEEVYEKAGIMARKRGVKSPSLLAKKIVEEAVEDISLGSEEYKRIYERVQSNEKKKYRDVKKR